MAYTDIDNPLAFFNSNLHTGVDGVQTISGVGFSADLTWFKNRSGSAQSHGLFDTVRGVYWMLSPNNSNGQAANDSLSSWNSDGFVIGNANSSGDAFSNLTNATYVSWNWKTGTAFSNDASATSVGSIDSAGSVNTAAGFSIIQYTGTGTAGTIAHGLGAVPAWYIVKKHNAAEHWQVYHQNNTSAPGTDYLQLSTADATTDAATRWNDTAPTSTVFSVNTHDSVNVSGGTYIAYCWTGKQGYSKFGTYEGNGNDNGPFIHTGFAPAFVMVKCFDQGEHWNIYDNKRGSSNALSPNLNNVDRAMDDSPAMELVSNGFKIRTSDNNLSNAGDSFLYMAFAAEPFVTSKGVPATAK